MDTIFGHYFELNDEEIESLYENQIHVVHCPESNMKLASGICPVNKLIERKCKAEGINDPRELKSPRLEYSDLQTILSDRSEEHKKRDLERRLNEDRQPYHNGALFGLDPTIPPDEIDEKWAVNVIPSADYIEKPRLAGSAWKHTERRHRGDS